MWYDKFTEKYGTNFRGFFDSKVEITDNGKLPERGGRKATGPKAFAMAARPPKVSILF